MSREGVTADRGLLSTTTRVGDVDATYNEETGSVYLNFNCGLSYFGMSPQEWAQLIPLLIEAMPEPARSQAIAAVAMIGLIEAAQ